MSVSNHLLSSQHVSKALTRLYNARPSKIPPFLDRTMRMLHDTYLDGLQVQKDATFHHSPWNIPFIKYANPFAKFNKNTTAPVVLQQIFYYHRCQYSDYTVFTDGSKADRHVGFGVIMDDASYNHILSVFCSVYTTEAMAISYALKLISSSQYRKLCIYSDSMSVLQQLENTESATHPILLNIADTVHCLKEKGFDIVFCWTPSHVGILGNEKADYVARTASIPIEHTVPLADIRKSVQYYIFNKWQETWDLQVNNKLHRIKPSIVLWPIFPIRGFDVKLTRLRIGHTWYTHIHLLSGD
ncbi:hypothetical protein AVEN_251138-1 [Araneus ventricosus]|uniref:RNase H type-1 domain-containing protein n=1 Tax=Araneus ventricosus TaxID=182803 RepID=A0A4Y2JPI6_ARAVE|nr:hypothetical protein AVEN_251138-1 [Araneus ventricosus]